ncbi:MtN3 and saliva related transmembrane protein [Lysobacter niabensis]|uniref:MtN3 and saliva related transmembrane protein n=1 Tax=Agrilutibacter niabensis TaxID=380628 RepID=A0ABU1VKH1_9GAMM|nr:SemiSWEET transporter [Lysobacter niabensis]MDR7097793.1 MtN3 and saliva related transmembrane protein [Lysobacter niabensis]
MSELVGYVAATLTTIAFVPQATRTLRTRNTAGISLAMYMLFTSGAACWLTYGIVIGSWPVILSNAITCLLSYVILMLKLRHG